MSTKPKKPIEQQSFSEIVESLSGGGSMTVPFYTWGDAGLRDKLNQMVRRGLLSKKKHKGYTEYFVPTPL